MTDHKIPYRRIAIILIPVAIAMMVISVTLGQDLAASKGGLHWFAFVHFLGYLFFLLMPVEMAYAYFAGVQSTAAMISIAVTTALAAQMVDYYIGLTMSRQIIDNFIGHRRYERMQKRIRRYGNLTILLFNLLPLSSPIVALAAGMLKYRRKHLLVYSGIGLVVKYAVLSYFFH